MNEKTPINDAQAALEIPLSLEAAQRLLQESRARQNELERENKKLRQAQAALEATQARNVDLYDAIFIHTPDHFSIQDRQLRYTLVINPPLGLTEQDMLGKNDFDFLTPEDAEKITHIKTQILETGLSTHVETSLLAHTGGLEHFDGTITPQYDTDGNIKGLIGYFRNVTERVQAENALRASEQKYRNLFEEMISGFALHAIVCDENGAPVDYITLEINRAYEQMLGVAKEAIVGKKAYESVPGLDREWLNIFGQVTLTGEPYHYLQHASNLGKWFEGVAYRPQIGQFAVTFVDITERKRAEEALQASEEKYHTIADFTYDWEFWLAPNGQILYTSPSCERVTGYAPDAFLQNPSLLAAIVHPADQTYFREHICFNNAESAWGHGIEYRIITRSGETRWISHRCQPVYSPLGKHLGRRGSNREITERKRAEDALRQANERLTLAQQSAGAGVWDWDMTTSQLSWSPEFFHLLGLNPTLQPSFDIWRDILHPEDRLRAEERINIAIREHIPLINEYRIILPTGEVRWIEALGNTIYNEGGEALRMSGICIDITKRKRIEDTLAESEIRARAMLHAIPDLMFRMDRQGVFLDYKADIKDLYVQPGATIIGKKNRDLTPPEFAALIDREIHITLESGTLQTFEYQLPIPGRGVRDYEARMVASGTDEVTAIIRDITDRVQVEQALRASEAMLRAVFNASRESIFLMNTDGTVIAANDTAAIRLHLETRELPGRNIYHYLPPSVVERRRQAVEQVIATAQPIRFEDERSGIWFDNSLYPILDDWGQVKQLAVYGHDITERKQMEETLRTSEERYRRISEMISDYAYSFRVETDRSLMTEWVIGGFEHITGFTPNELKALGGWITLIHPEDMPIVAERSKRLLSGQTDVSEFRIVRKDGILRWLRDHGQPIWDEAQGRVTHIYGAAQDITESKRTEREREVTVRLLQLLNERNNLHELIQGVTALLQEWSGCEAIGIRLRRGEDYPYFETSGFPPAFVEKENRLCVYNLAGQILRDPVGNPVLECMCGNVICGRFNPDKPFFTANGSFWTNCTTQLLASTSEADRQARTRNRCNGEGYESVALIALKTTHQVFGLLQLNDHRCNRFTPEDIALYERLANNLALALSQRQSEEALRTSLVEKETLLKEVHHRVKNNLASIAGLIGLQQETLSDPSALAELDELRGRIHSMALVHELLYQTENLSQIDLHDYLTTLAFRLRSAYDPGALIQLNVAATDVIMTLDSAIPCGLIVNELVTNAFKYAFPKGQPRPGQSACEVSITATWDGRTYTLIVHDNGVGLPTHLDWADSPSLGLQLVVMLGQRQLNGEIELDRSTGTTFRLRFAP
jgi:PAS domain S-box-containing protein